jgi:hypothetical protein
MLRRSVDDVSDNLHGVRDNVRHWMHPAHESPTPGPSEISITIHEAVERALRVIDLPTRSDIESLQKSLERLASALEGFEARIGRSEED